MRSAKDDCLLYLHKLNAYNINIHTVEQYYIIQATLPNNNIVTIRCGMEFYPCTSTITYKEDTFEIDPNAEEATLLYFLL